MADVTGMKGQEKDEGAVEAGRGKRALQWTKEHIPYSDARKAKKQRDKIEDLKAEERAKLEVQKEATQSDATPADVKALKGEYIPPFMQRFMNALRRGHGTEASEVGLLVRNAFCNERFITAVAMGEVKTPIEARGDRTYRKEMVEERKMLAAQLQKAAASKDYTLPPLNGKKLDIIFHTALGKPSIWEGEGWKENSPNPAETIMIVAESFAVVENPEKADEVLGNILKFLVTTRSFTKGDDRTKSMLADSDYIYDHIKRKSAPPIRKATEEFEGYARGLLALPTSEMHPELGVPGIGYQQHYDARLQTLTKARDEAKSMHDEASRRFNDAKAAYDDVMGKKEAAQPNWKKLKPELQKRILDAEQQTGELLDQQRAVYNRTGNALSAREEDLRRFVATQSPEAHLSKLVENFKEVLTQAKVANASAEAVEQKAEPLLVNPLVRRLLTEAEEAMLQRTISEKFATPALVAVREEIDGLLDQRDKVQELMARFEAREQKGPQPAKASAVTNLLDELDVAMVTKINSEKEKLDQRLGELKQAIDGASFPPEVLAPLQGVMESMPNYGIPRAYVEWQLGAILVEDKHAAVQAMAEAAPLPQQTKAEISKVNARLRKSAYNPEEVRSEIAALMKSTAFPLGKAAARALKALDEDGYGNLTGMTPQQWMGTRIVYDTVSAGYDDSKGGRDGWFATKMKKARYHLFTVDSYKNKGSWLLDHTVKNDLEDIFSKNRTQRLTTEMPDGEERETKIPRWAGGATKLGLKAYLVVSLVVWGTHSPSFPEHFFRWPVRSPVTASYQKSPHSHWYNPGSYDWGIRNPLTWTTVAPRPPSQIVRVIGDNENNYVELANRDSSFYMRHYGLGRRLPGEQDDRGMEARLEWVRSKPAVLKYFQERRTLKEYTSYEGPDVVGRNFRNPDMCSTGQRRIPEYCENLGLHDAQAIQDYEFPEDRDDGWRADNQQMRVCCFVRLSPNGGRAITDGRMLNRSQSDRFVQSLMASERNDHATINAAYLNDPNNRARFVHEWFLVTPTEDDIMEHYGIGDRDNIQFIVAQGSKATNALLPRCSTERGMAPEMIQAGHRDEFVHLWRQEIQNRYAGHDLTAEDVPQEILDAAFSAVRQTALNNRWIEDTSTEFARRQLRQEFSVMNLRTDTAIDAIRAQTDLREFVRMFANVNGSFRINPDLSDDFVIVLQEHKLAGGSLNDFNPFADAWGPRVQWALNMHYLLQQPAQTGNENRQGATPAPGATAQQQAPAPAPAPDLTPEAERFYASSSNLGFNQFLDGVIASLRDGRDSQTMDQVQRTRFGGNRERMDRAIRAEVYRLLTSNGERDAVMRAGYGVTVTGSGESMTVATGNPRTARNSFRHHILEFVREQGAVVNPPRR